MNSCHHWPWPAEAKEPATLVAALSSEFWDYFWCPKIEATPTLQLSIVIWEESQCIWSFYMIISKNRMIITRFSQSQHVQTSHVLNADGNTVGESSAISPLGQLANDCWVPKRSISLKRPKRKPWNSVITKVCHIASRGKALFWKLLVLACTPGWGSREGEPKVSSICSCFENLT